MAYFIVRNFLKLFFKIIMGFKVYGVENVPKKGGFILAGNHVSHLDPPALASASPRVLHFMARHTLFNNWVLGWIIGSCNSFPVRRGEADLGAIKEAVRRLKNGKVLLIFPEGTRSQSGEIQAAQPGIGYLSLMAGVPILPAYVKGTDEAMPKGAQSIKRVRISVYFGSMIEPQKLGLPADRRQASQQLADHIVEEIKRLGEAKNKIQ
ncbi:MAG: lysophospholipid acyltransferase family protein [Candidatus Omnitrophota bacterium]|nr:lysophospholipid acyltransferase family protein [Candidatus Omnitrophota bacterium]MDP3786230.1 lysophospholipid acyltransferase family protein [Candidatus Omnitrophota bacterium]